MMNPNQCNCKIPFSHDVNCNRGMGPSRQPPLMRKTTTAEYQFTGSTYSFLWGFEQCCNCKSTIFWAWKIPIWLPELDRYQTIPAIMCDACMAIAPEEAKREPRYKLEVGGRTMPRIYIGEYTANTLSGLIWEIFKHRCYHLWRDHRWKD